MITIYSKDYCPYCVKVKQFFTQRGLAYEEVDVQHNPNKLDEMLARAGGRRTVPQIFIHGKHVGGYDDMMALKDSGKLDEMLKG